MRKFVHGFSLFVCVVILITVLCACNANDDKFVSSTLNDTTSIGNGTSDKPADLVEDKSGKVSFNSVNASSASALSVEGNIAYIGEYPQTICTDAETIAALDLLTPQTDGYYHYNDERYVKCTTEKYPGNGKYSDNSTPENGVVKYFKVEPLKWFVIGENEDMLMLVSYQIVDTHAWQTQFVGDTSSSDCKITVPDGNGGTKQLDANDWQYSELRSWLNTDFYDTAFSTGEKKSVLKVTTSAEKTASAVSTDGFVNFLSRQDFEANKARIKDTGATDYAIAQGLYYFFDDYKYAFYWVNDVPESDSAWGDNKGYAATSRGYEMYGGLNVDEDNVGVRPVIYVDVNQAEITLTDNEKEAKTQDALLIAGIIVAVAGLMMAIFATTAERQFCKKNNIDYKSHKPGKKFVAVFVPAILLMFGGVCMAVIPTLVLGGAAPDGLYVQIESISTDGSVQEGLTAYDFDSNGTVRFTDSYDGGSTSWRNGTWTQSGKSITVTFSGSWGFTKTYTVNSSGDTLSFNGTPCYEKQE